MINFLVNYWMLFLILFIIILIFSLEYLHRKEKKRINNIEDKYNYKLQDDNLESKDIYDLKNQCSDTEIECTSDKREERNFNDNVIFDVDIKNETKANESNIESNVTTVSLNYDEFEQELSKIDQEFSSIVPKKELVDNKLKESIQNIKIDPIKISNSEDSDDEIKLPDIKLN